MNTYWPVPELTPVYEAYKLALFREPVTPIAQMAKEILKGPYQ
jgi:hypothetical protein